MRTFILLLFVVSLYGQSRQLVKAFKSAQRYIDNHQYQSALEILQKQTPSNHPRLNFLLGICYFSLGNYEEALAAFEKAYEKRFSDKALDPLQLQWYYARALLINEKPSEALKLFQEYRRQLLRKPIENPADQRALLTRRRQLKLVDLYIAYCKNAIHYLQNPLKVEVKNLGAVINSPYPDFAPVITADEQKLFFTSRRPGNKGKIASDGFPYEDIYVSERDSQGNWQQPRPLETINTDFHDATIAISPDGLTLFILRSDNGGDLYFSEFHQGVWTPPKNLNVLSSDGRINTEAWEPSVCISADGKMLFFVSDREDAWGRRQRDIFYCYRLSNGKWSSPQRLPYPINTEYEEDAPFLHPDGKTLYFSSNRPESMGGFDIFYSVRNENGQWSKPVNLGYPINTTGDDLYFVLSASGKHGYYASKRKDSFGEKDIYLIDFSPLWAENKKNLHASVVLLKGWVKSAKTQQPLEAKIIIVNLEKQDTYAVTRSEPTTGNYLVTITPGKYAIFVHAKNHLDYSKHIVISEEQVVYREVVENILLEPIEEGKRVILRNVFFDFDKATLRPESKVELDKWVRFLKENPELKIEIAGHTDLRGSQQHNLKLSEARAKAVYDYFVTKGIAPRRMRYKGYGASQPLTYENTEEAHQKNRRVEIWIVEKK